MVDKQESGGKVAVELDQSCFYPSAGGQPNDLGWIDQIPVLDVEEKEDRILHYLEENRFKVGQSVQGRIDWKRRFDHMQQHTGQHILSQSFLQILSSKTVSFHLGIELSTIDLTRETLTPQEIYQVEDLANQIILKIVPSRLMSGRVPSSLSLPCASIQNAKGRFVSLRSPILIGLPVEAPIAFEPVKWVLSNSDAGKEPRNRPGWNSTADGGPYRTTAGKTGPSIVSPVSIPALTGTL